MLNHADYYITNLEFPYENLDGWSVKLTFKHRKNGKTSQGFSSGRDGWMKVAEQCKRQVGAGEFYKITHEPKPKKRPVAQAPIGKVKGKGKAKAAK